jgi:membrane protease YdiL (CAAX protease family)
LASGLALSVVVYGLLEQAFLNGSAPPLLRVVLVQGGAGLAGFGAVTWAFARWVVRLDAEALRWRPAALAGFARGVVLGAIPAVVVMLLGVVAGGRWVPDGAGVGAWAAQVVQLAAALLPSALGEEIIFRGLPLVVLGLAWRRGTAIAIMAALFALAHAANPEVTVLALGNVALAGAYLGVVFYLPGGAGLWGATGAHFGWNLTLAALAAPVSGVPLSMPGLDFEPSSAAWLTGGGFGPEGGLLATITLCTATGVAARYVRQERGG